MSKFASSQTPDAGAADFARTQLEAAGGHLDLVRAPFTLPRSRLILFAAGEGIRVCTSEYERRLDDCVVVEKLIVRGPGGAEGVALAVTRVLPQQIEFGGGAVTLTFAGAGALSLGVAESAQTVGVSVELHNDGAQPVVAQLGGGHPASIRLDVSSDRSFTIVPGDEPAHEAHRVTTERIWLDWFARCPRVRADLQDMTAFCWWVLGANIVELPALGRARAVVPSKIGYVGLWQWDAYFIAVGLRHGDPELAREQLGLAFGFAREDGQLPDVVHELGVLATSDDLPQSDRDTLRRAGSTIADPSVPVPLTKPPLAAWALRKVLEVQPASDWDGGEEWLREQLATVQRSQDWWFTGSDLDGDGMPEYGHPYSSGLDDSPIFDGPLPTTSPDLGAYLVLQDLELAGFAERLGLPGVEGHRERAARTLELLLAMWDADAGHFRARAAGSPVGTYAIVSLMPLLTGALPAAVTERMLADLDDETQFAAPWTVPTVSRSDPDFSPERMWRGPVWINTNALIVEGLHASGEHERATALAERTVALVIRGGGPHEYFNPLTGQKARTATTAFGWSSALFIDLAVQLSA